MTHSKYDNFREEDLFWLRVSVCHMAGRVSEQSDSNHGGGSGQGWGMLSPFSSVIPLVPTDCEMVHGMAHGMDVLPQLVHPGNVTNAPRDVFYEFPRYSSVHPVVSQSSPSHSLEKVSR